MSNWINLNLKFNCFDNQLSPGFTDGSLSSGTSSCSSPVPSPGNSFCDGQTPADTWPQPIMIKQEPALDLCTNKTPYTSGPPSQQPKKSSRRRVHIPHSQRPHEFVVKRNARERRRVEAVNDAFHVLQETVPTMRTRGAPQRLSKASILRGAIDYIQQLHIILGISNEHDGQEFYQNNNPMVYGNHPKLPENVYQSRYVTCSSTPPEIPSPVSETLPTFPAIHATWQSPEKEPPQQSVGDLLDTYWTNMGIDDITAGISFSDIELDL